METYALIRNEQQRFEKGVEKPVLLAMSLFIVKSTFEN